MDMVAVSLSHEGLIQGKNYEFMSEIPTDNSRNSIMYVVKYLREGEEFDVVASFDVGCGRLMKDEIQKLTGGIAIIDFPSELLSIWRCLQLKIAFKHSTNILRIQFGFLYSALGLPYYLKKEHLLLYAWNIEYFTSLYGFLWASSFSFFRWK